jgi:hypothetical protein
MFSKGNPCINVSVACFNGLFSGWDYQIFDVFTSTHPAVPPPRPKGEAAKDVGMGHEHGHGDGQKDGHKHDGDCCEHGHNHQDKEHGHGHGHAESKGGMTVTAAEDVGDVVVIECGTVKGDSVSTAMLLNEICAALEKETGRKVSRVVLGTPVDGSAPILSLRLKKSMVRCEGKSFTLAEVPDIAQQLTAKAA